MTDRHAAALKAWITRKQGPSRPAGVTIRNLSGGVRIPVPSRAGGVRLRGGRLSGLKQAAKAFLGTQSRSEARQSTGLAGKINRAADAIGRFEGRIGRAMTGRRGRR